VTQRPRTGHGMVLLAGAVRHRPVVLSGLGSLPHGAQSLGAGLYRANDREEPQMQTKPHTVLRIESERDDLNIMVTSVLVVCEDGSVYTYSIGHSDEWFALPPIPGTPAGRGDRSVDG
jgi:hypothetical protein